MAEQLTEAVARAMQAGNGRGPGVRSPDELIARLSEDGVQTGRDALEPVLEQMLADGVIEYRQGIGLWLSSNIRSIWLDDHSEPEVMSRAEADIRWGPDGFSNSPQLRFFR